MFGLPPQTLFIIAAIAVMALSMVPKTFWLSLVPKVQKDGSTENSEPPKMDRDLPSVRYIQVQNSLLDIKDLCHDCPEALAAIDAAIKATVAMVVKSQPVTMASLTSADAGSVLGQVNVVKAAPLPPRTVEVGQ